LNNLLELQRKMFDRLSAAVDDIEEHTERNKVVVRVPATSANLGPGFDAIGMALDMWSEFTVERSDVFEVVCEGEGSNDMPLDESNLVSTHLYIRFSFVVSFIFNHVHSAGVLWISSCI
jgi:hypothetical protein